MHSHVATNICVYCDHSMPLQEPDTSVYDAFLEQLAEDTKQYVIAVFKTLTATVPKAIIHAQVRS
jgi:hypothetical protein